MQYYRTEYFKESFWNIIESFSFFIYLSFVIIRMTHGFASDMTFEETLLSLILMVAGFFKVLSFMRIYEKFGFLVQMVFMTISELMQFYLFFIMWIAFFTICFITLQIDFSKYLDYPEVHEKIVAFLEVYQWSIGNSRAPNYKHVFEVEGKGF